MNIIETLRTSVYTALSALTGNTCASYPASIFDNETDTELPLIVYELSMNNTDSLAAHGFRNIEVEVTVDLFADSRDALSDLAWSARLAMRKIIPTCTLDRYTVMPNGLIRQTQTYRGRMDVETGIIYTY